jgi:hypothetical protein
MPESRPARPSCPPSLPPDALPSPPVYEGIPVRPVRPVTIFSHPSHAPFTPAGLHSGGVDVLRGTGTSCS